ncbi:MAG: hypothetical protein LH606_04105 [Cytophagaceae bacterium]|nr:hypothetical protein [Cytophagaceae bacterium]
MKRRPVQWLALLLGLWYAAMALEVSEVERVCQYETEAHCYVLADAPHFDFPAPTAVAVLPVWSLSGVKKLLFATVTASEPVIFHPDPPPPPGRIHARCAIWLI